MNPTHPSGKIIANNKTSIIASLIEKKILYRAYVTESRVTLPIFKNIRKYLTQNHSKVRVVSVNMTKHSSKLLQDDKDEESTGSHSGIIAFLHVDLYNTLENKQPKNEVAGRCMELKFSSASFSFVDLIVYQVSGLKILTSQIGSGFQIAKDVSHWVHSKLTLHSKGNVCLMGDFQTVRYTHHRFPPHFIPNVDTNPFSLHHLADPFTLNHVSVQHGRPIATYAPKNVDVSIIDHLYASTSSPHIACATATKLLPFSKTHRALLFSFSSNPLIITGIEPPTPPADDTPRNGPQRWGLHTSHKHKRHLECPDKCGSCKYQWHTLTEAPRLEALSDATTKYTQSTPTEPHPTDEDMPEHQREKIRNAGNDLATSIFKILSDAAEDTSASLKKDQSGNQQTTKQNKKIALETDHLCSILNAWTEVHPAISQLASHLVQPPQPSKVPFSVINHLTLIQEHYSRLPDLPRQPPPIPSYNLPPHRLTSPPTTVIDTTNIPDWISWGKEVIPWIQTTLLDRGQFRPNLNPTSPWIHHSTTHSGTKPPSHLDQLRSLSSKDNDGALDGLFSPEGIWTTNTQDLHDLIINKTEKMYKIHWYPTLIEDILWRSFKQNSLTRYRMRPLEDTKRRAALAIQHIRRLRPVLISFSQHPNAATYTELKKWQHKYTSKSLRTSPLLTPPSLQLNKNG